jgi:SAM-dependent methyltransferase
VNLAEFAALASSDERWQGVTRLPWGDEAFSRRMLREHLSQAHDGASRRSEVIERQVRWIHEHVLRAAPKRVLDLGCGPGLYTKRLAMLGHTCTGIDIGPASIEYAREHAGERERYELGDMMAIELDADQDLVMLIHGEFNVVPREQAPSLLRRMGEALAPHGRVLLEVHHHAAVRAMGERRRTWMALPSGLFSDSPHLRFDESRWSDNEQTACNLNWIIDAATGGVVRYGTVTQAHERTAYLTMLRDAGFSRVDEFGSLHGGESDENYLVLVAECE